MTKQSEVKQYCIIKRGFSYAIHEFVDGLPSPEPVRLSALSLDDLRDLHLATQEAFSSEIKQIETADGYIVSDLSFQVDPETQKWIDDTNAATRKALEKDI